MIIAAVGRREASDCGLGIAVGQQGLENGGGGEACEDQLKPADTSACVSHHL